MNHHLLFNERSDAYAQARPRYPDALYTFLASQCEQHDTAWDAACGNGQAAVDLAKHFDRVQATDISEHQIANALQSPNVHYAVQPSETTQFKDSQFDLVCVAQALHWFDHDIFWPEVQRVLKPNGVFAAWGYTWFQVTEQIDALIQVNLLDAIQPYWAAQNKILWNHYQDIPFPFPRITTPQLALKMTWDLNQLFAYLHSWSATRRCIADIGEMFFTEAYHAVQSLWQNAEEPKEITMDFCLLAGRNPS